MEWFFVSLELKEFQTEIQACYSSQAKSGVFALTRNSILALAGWLTWLECHPVNPGLAVLIHNLGTCLGFQFRPPLR